MEKKQKNARARKYQPTGDTPGKRPVKSRRIMGYSKEELAELPLKQQIELMQEQLEMDKELEQKVDELRQQVFGMGWNVSDYETESSSSNNHNRILLTKSKSKSKKKGKTSKKEIESEESDSNTRESSEFTFGMNENKKNNKCNNTKKKHIVSKSSMKYDISNDDFEVSKQLLTVLDAKKFANIKNQSEFVAAWNNGNSAIFKLKKSGFVRFYTPQAKKLKLPVEIRIERVKSDPTEDERKIISIVPKDVKNKTCSLQTFVATFKKYIEDGDEILKNFEWKQGMCKDLFFLHRFFALFVSCCKLFCLFFCFFCLQRNWMLFWRHIILTL